MEYIFEALVSAVFAIAVPLVLDKIRSSSKKKSGEVPWANWLVACTIGGGVGGLLSGIFSAAAGNQLVFGGYGNWAAFGVSIGVFQWITLRHYIKISNNWALLTMIGWMAFAFLQSIQFMAYLDWIVIGLLVGLLQWISLRNRVEKPALWILANGIAWVIAGTVGFQFGVLMVGSGISFPVAWVIGWAIVGLIGGVILRFFLVSMHPVEAPEEDSTPTD
ncbi:MAG: hypothetical protein GXO86_00320 [Chlorobi bacterium]|nr:hypothetical protein [Chlorobiota bacterium]